MAADAPHRAADAEPSEAELAAAANRGAPGALEALYLRHRDWVHAQALRFSGDREEALDVLQETFLYLFGKFPGLTLTCQLRTFLYPVVRHLALAARRRRGRTVSLELSPVGPDGPAAPPPAPAREAAAERERLAELLVRLPEADRELLLLRFGEGLKLAELAARLDLPLGTVKSRLSRALAALRRRTEARKG